MRQFWIVLAGALVLILAGCASEENAGATQQEPPMPRGGIIVPTQCANHPANLRDERNRPLQAAIDDAITWLRANTIFTNIDVPCVIWASASDLARLPNVERRNDAWVEMKAVYYCALHSVFLRDDMAETLIDGATRSTLLHEFIHHGQCRQGGMTARSACDLEMEAYRIQADYLIARAESANTSPYRRHLFLNAERLHHIAEHLCPARSS